MVWRRRPRRRESPVSRPPVSPPRPAAPHSASASASHPTAALASAAALPAPRAAPGLHAPDAAHRARRRGPSRNPRPLGAASGFYLFFSAAPSIPRSAPRDEEEIRERTPPP